MLALIIVGAPNSFLIGVIAATVGMTFGILLGFTGGFVGGRVDDVIRTISDVAITIPALLVLIVIQSLLKQVELSTMALLIALQLDHDLRVLDESLTTIELTLFWRVIGLALYRLRRRV